MTESSLVPARVKARAKIIYNYALSLFSRKRISSFRNLSLGDSGFPFDGFVSAGFGGVIRLDITKRPPKWMHGKYNIIYSERMLEHIESKSVATVLKNISLLLAEDGICRMSLPVCFSEIQTNMMRAGNSKKCKDLGHITWFTKEGFGDVDENLFGLSEAPSKFLTSWKVALEGLDLEIRFHRSYDSSGKQVNDSRLAINSAGYYSDLDTVRTKRPQSLIFDIIKTPSTRTLANF